MFSIKFARRHLLKDRLFAILNLVGLSTGLASAILIYLWVNDEQHFDRFFKNDSRLFQVMINQRQGDHINTGDAGGVGLGEALKKEIPEIESAVTTAPAAWFRNFNISYGPNTMHAEGNFVGKDYFTVFPYGLVHGSAEKLLSVKNSIVISADLAKKIFNTTDGIIGKTLEWKWYSFTRQVVITGVFNNFPANSSYQFDFLLPLEAWKDVLSASDDPDNAAPTEKPAAEPAGDPTGGPFNTFVVLKKTTNIDQLNKKIAGFISSRWDNPGSSLFLRKYSDAYLYGNYENGVQAGGRIEYVWLFSAIAIFILIIACINFMNLSTAKASGRAREVGIRKTLGARRSRLIFSFLGESILMSFVSLTIAIAMIVLMLPQFNAITGKHILITFDPAIILSVLGIVLFTGLIAGSYPAFYLSHFKPAVTLKGALNGSVSELLVRKGLVVFQFSLSIIFIIVVIVVDDQIGFIQVKNPGYKKDNVIYFEMAGKVPEKLETFLTGIKSIPGVVNASSIQNSIILPSSTPAPGVYWEGRNSDDNVRFYQLAVNYDMIETLGIEMASGRSFSREFGADTAAVVINEAAVKAMGMKDPVGKLIEVWGGRKRVVGVTKNFHFNSLHETVRPFIFRLEPASTLLIMAKINVQKGKETISQLATFYKNFNPGFSFDFKFLDEDYQRQYSSEKLVVSLSGYFAALATIISCLGLFGLAAFTGERRRKEIGIRKVLGASVKDVVGLLSKDFLKLILLAIVIGFPMAWWGADQWLRSFAYRTPVRANVFLIAGCSIFLIALFTISFQSVRSALENPVKSLK